MVLAAGALIVLATDIWTIFVGEVGYEEVFIGKA